MYDYLTLHVRMQRAEIFIDTRFGKRLGIFVVGVERRRFQRRIRLNAFYRMWVVVLIDPSYGTTNRYSDCGRSECIALYAHCIIAYACRTA